jgi:hypothetical protein
MRKEGDGMHAESRASYPTFIQLRWEDFGWHSQTFTSHLNSKSIAASSMKCCRAVVVMERMRRQSTSDSGVMLKSLTFDPARAGSVGKLLHLAHHGSWASIFSSLPSLWSSSNKPAGASGSVGFQRPISRVWASMSRSVLGWTPYYGHAAFNH